MSSTILELMRLNHETIENAEQAICDELDNYPTGQKAKVLQQHKVSKILNHLVEKSNELSNMYKDDDNLLKEELSVIRSGNPGMFSSFYETLNRTREYHQRFPNQSSTDSNSIKNTIKNLINESSLNISFSGEEIFGKYLDLNYHYFLYLNIPQNTVKNIDYIQYLDIFSNFFHIKPEMRHQKAYVDYLNQLWEYLYQFFYRIQPLIDLNEIIKTEWEKDFLNLQNNNKMKNGSSITTSHNTIGQSNSPAPQPLRLGMFNSSSELEALGSDRLAEGLHALGLKAGGTLKDRAERLWSVRGKKPEEYPKKLLAKAVKTVTANGDAGDTTTSGQSSTVTLMDPTTKTSWLEYRITKIAESMLDIVTATRHHSEKQQLKTKEEKESEVRDEEFGYLPDITGGGSDGSGGGAGDDDDEEPIYNPLNLPLGWDGKPIPYWLYKLHGLGVEYKCEVCGNQSYWGRRAFDRHFQEWRHAHGMRCLGVPNTKHFHDIVLIEDVLALYAKIKESLKTDQFVVDVHEEFEDSDGNVLNRRTFEDLARQGLL